MIPQGTVFTGDVTRADRVDMPSVALGVFVALLVVAYVYSCLEGESFADEDKFCNAEKTVTDPLAEGNEYQTLSPNNNVPPAELSRSILRGFESDIRSTGGEGTDRTSAFSSGNDFCKETSLERHGAPSEEPDFWKSNGYGIFLELKTLVSVWI